MVFPAGGPSDTEARIMCKHVEKVLGQRVIIQNVAGAGGVAGWNNMRGAEKDGYWLTGYNVPHIFTQPLVVKEANFSREDFIPIIHWANDPTVFAVKADSPYKSLADIVAESKAKPDTVTLGMAGRFLGHHLAVLQLEDAANIQIKDIPFQGSAASIAAMLGGQTRESRTICPICCGKGTRCASWPSPPPLVTPWRPMCRPSPSRVTLRWS